MLYIACMMLVFGYLGVLCEQGHRDIIILVLTFLSLILVAGSSLYSIIRYATVKPPPIHKGQIDTDDLQ